MGTIEIIGLISAIVGIVSFVWFVYERKPFKKIAWRKAEKSSRNVVDKMYADKFIPTLIFGIGRGGAIFGAMISGCVGHLPLIVIDRKYVWSEKGRFEDLIFPLNVPGEYLERVLLVAGEVHSGATMKRYYEYVNRLGAKEIRKSVLFWEEGSPLEIDYFGIKSNKKNILLPWMYTKNYIREDRESTRSCEETPDYKIKAHLIRHAEAESGEDIFTGSNDPPLTSEGIRQALHTGHQYITCNINTIFTSPLGRAEKTAMIIHDFTPTADFTIDNNLREMDFGNWEGLKRSEIKENFSESYESWNKDPFNNPPEGSEHPEEVLKRLQRFLNELEYKYSTSKGIQVIVVMHKTAIRLLLSHINKEPLKDFRKRKIENCQIFEIIYNGKKWEFYEKGSKN